jgi:peptidoglycan/LPS O-acetylase OafA/YrhL
MESLTNHDVRLPLPRCPHYASLDFWRGMACLMVVIYHSANYLTTQLQEAHGVARFTFSAIGYFWLGVPLFFVISGYCISATCDSARRKPGSARTYFWRRYRRIFPPYWIFSAITVLVLLVAGSVHQSELFTNGMHHMVNPNELSGSQWLGNVTLTESWRQLVFGDQRQYLLGQAWSLCYEEQFYLLCGLLLLLVPNFFFRATTYLSVLVGAAAATAWFLHAPSDGLFFDGRWFTFFFGVLVYWIQNYSSRYLDADISRAALVASILIVALFTIRPLRIYALSGARLEFASALIFALALLCLRRFDAKITSSPMLFPISWCGSMCYSLYLSHWTVVKPISMCLWRNGFRSPSATMFITIPACLAASIVVSRAFYLLVEKRFLNTRPAIGARRKRSELDDQVAAAVLAG